MSDRVENLLVEVSPAETRIAVVDESGDLLEFRVDRINAKSLVEGVYRGRVVRVEKGLGAAFLDIGVGENVFLNRSGKVHEGQIITVQVSRNAGGGNRRRSESVLRLPVGLQPICQMRAGSDGLQI